MVGSAASSAGGGLLQVLLARKGEATPAAPITPLQPERLAVSIRRPAGAGKRLLPGNDSPLAFLIARRPSGAVPAVDAGMRREAEAPATGQRSIEVAAAAPRRTLTVRLRQEDFLRLRALTEARAATYQSLIEAGILAILTAGAPTALAQTTAPDIVAETDGVTKRA